MKSSKLFALLSLGLLALVAAGPTTHESATYKFLTAADLYTNPNPPRDIQALMGKRVEVEVVVKIARETPLVDIVKPAGNDKAETIQAHLYPKELVGELPKDRRVLIKGIIVDEGFGAYMIFVNEVSRPK